MLFDVHAWKCDLFQRCMISGYYIYKIEVVGLGSFLSGYLMQLAKYTIITTVSSCSSVTMHEDPDLP